jgi:hypothetical protein
MLTIQSNIKLEKYNTQEEILADFKVWEDRSILFTIGWYQLFNTFEYWNNLFLF